MEGLLGSLLAFGSRNLQRQDRCALDVQFLVGGQSGQAVHGGGVSGTRCCARQSIGSKQPQGVLLLIRGRGGQRLDGLGIAGVSRRLQRSYGGGSA